MKTEPSACVNREVVNRSDIKLVVLVQLPGEEWARQVLLDDSQADLVFDVLPHPVLINHDTIWGVQLC